MKPQPRSLLILHWLTVVLLFASALLAKQKEMDGLPLNFHTILGAVLVLVMVARVIVRISAPVSSTLISKLIFTALYAAVFFILGMGGWIAYQRNLPGHLIHPASAIGRGGFHQLGEIHKMGWNILIGLVVLHVGVTFYEQFSRKAH